MSGRVRFTASAAVVALLVGCGSSDRLAVHPVRGEVKVNGLPAAGARVFFHSATDPGNPRGLHPVAVVEPDGTFHLTTYLAKDGAPAGDYVVTVTWPLSAGGDDEGAGDRLKGAYASPTKSTLRATVKAGTNVLEPFVLK